MKISKKYTRELYRNFKYLATWEPNVPLELGDIGVLKGKEFTRIGNIKSDLGIDFEVREDTTPGSVKYVSKSGVSFTAKASGTVPPTGSTLEKTDLGFNISFSKEKAIFFEAEGTYNHSIKSSITLGKEILKLYDAKKWDKDWVVITELMKADSSTILISLGRKGSVDIKVNAETEVTSKNMRVTNPSLDLSVSFFNNVSAEIIAEKGLTPLFKVSKVKKPFLGAPIFKANKTMVTLGNNKNALKMPDDDLLEFSEITFDEDGDLEV
ncbi:hypothetical protein [Kordia sp.]|uniref:hypothetical protein n=1 Tax=Kordia sp. TaxID=1965332 RepID=UPI003D28B772